MDSKNIESYITEKEAQSRDMKKRILASKKRLLGDKTADIDIGGHLNEKNAKTRFTTKRYPKGSNLVELLRNKIEDHLSRIESEQVETAQTRLEPPSRQNTGSDLGDTSMFEGFFRNLFNKNKVVFSNVPQEIADLPANFQEDPEAFSQQVIALSKSMSSAEFAQLMKEIFEQKKSDHAGLSQTARKAWSKDFEHKSNSLLQLFEMLKNNEADSVSDFLAMFRSLQIEVKNITERFRKVVIELGDFSKSAHVLKRMQIDTDFAASVRRHLYNRATGNHKFDRGDGSGNKTGDGSGFGNGNANGNGNHYYGEGTDLSFDQINLELIQQKLGEFVENMVSSRIHIKNLSELTQNYPKKIPSKSGERVFYEFRKNVEEFGLQEALIKLIDDIPYEFMLVPYPKIVIEIKKLTDHPNPSIARVQFRTDFNKYLTMYHLYLAFNEYNVWYKKLIKNIFGHLFEYISLYMHTQDKEEYL